MRDFVIDQGTKSNDSVAIGGLSNDDLAQKIHPVFTRCFFTIPKEGKSKDIQCIAMEFFDFPLY